MGRLLRLLKHRRWDERDVKRVLPETALGRLQAQVVASELDHGGEIRICVEAGLPLSYLWRRLSARDRAVMLFGKLRVWDTEHNNGVLIYLLLAEHAIEIVADRGLNRHVDSAAWAALLGPMRSAFRSGQFEQGLSLAVSELDRLLRQHFAAEPGTANPDELPDAPVLL